MLSAILSFSEMHDYKVEADRSAAALESAEEDLKDLKKANQQVKKMVVMLRRVCIKHG